MCTFNGGRFLGAQLDSIAAQERLPDELVVCDDGSSDGCEEMVRQFSRRVAFPTRLVINEQNLGTTKNFEKAISLCQGGIVALADQDDVWYRHKLARIEKSFLRSDATVAVFSDADLIDADSRLLRVRLWDSYLFTPREQRRFANGHALAILTRNHIVTGATMAFRKKLFDVFAPFQDLHDRWLGFLLAANGPFEPISEPLMQYRRHEGQQFGPGALTLRETVAQIKSMDTNVYLGEIERFQKLLEWVEKHKANFRHAALAQQEIKRKILHLERRVRLPGKSVARIPKILREVFNGDYWRYSAGWKSVAKDLVLRPNRS
ncbi:MAG: glycosyltransferase family 2 protein [Candidatus Sulfotelmatobacter sp.]